MKNAAPEEGRRGANDSVFLPGPSPTFRIAKLLHVDFGSKRLEFTVEIDGVASICMDLFRRDDGSAWVAPRSVRSKYSGAYERTFRLADAFADAILKAVGGEARK